MKIYVKLTKRTLLCKFEPTLQKSCIRPCNLCKHFDSDQDRQNVFLNYFSEKVDFEKIADEKKHENYPVGIEFNVSSSDGWLFGCR